MDKPKPKHVGLHLGLLFCIHLQKFERLHLYVKMLRNVWVCQTYETFFFVMLGMTAKMLLKNYTICWNQKVSQFGLVKKMFC